MFPSAEASFHNEGEFDHSPMVPSVYPDVRDGKRPFKYFTMWKQSPHFEARVRAAWEMEVQGTKMFKVVQKLKAVKKTLKELNKEGFTDIQAIDLRAHREMVAAQQRMHANPRNHQIAQEELIAVREYQDKHKAYIAFLSEKAKSAWIKEGDENTSLFHQSIRERKGKNQVYGIFDAQGNWQDTHEGVNNAFLSYYESLLSKDHGSRVAMNSQLVQEGPVITQVHKEILNAPYTVEEVKKALKSIPGNKALGADGFGTYFYSDV